MPTQTQIQTQTKSQTWPVAVYVCVCVCVCGLRPSDSAPPPVSCRVPGPDPKAIAAFLRARCYAGWPHDRTRVRRTGPEPGGSAPHGKVRVYYSPEVHAWLAAGRPAVGIPDGGFIYKEMYDWESERYTGGAFMLRRRAGSPSSYDGWYWGGYSERTGAAWGAFAYPGCLNCHASAERELTFAALELIEREAPPAAADDGRAPQRQSHLHPPPRRVRQVEPEELLAEPSARRSPAAAFLSRYPVSFTLERATAYRLPDENLADDLVAGPKGPDLFLPAPACARCHSAEPPGLMSLPAPEPRGWYLDLSPAGEWSGSLMALSGRDPVFFAQLEYEKTLRPGYAAYLDDTCYGCHGVMGQRQLRLDRGAPFSHDMIYAGAGDPDAKYGALARDGVSCTACHRIAAAGLGQERSFSGAFRTAPAGEIYGPYEEDVKGRPMQNALGITPKGSPHLRASALCGSCHTVLLPRERATTRGLRGPPKGDLVHEQATYLEWRHSAFSDEGRAPGAEPRSCQSCHMPAVYTGDDGRERPLKSKIANIEEYLPHVRNSLPRRDLNLPVRRPFARHTLVGLNYFVLAMFDQFDKLLGVPQPAPPADDPTPLLPGPALTRRETLRLAEKETAQVELVGAPRREGEELVVRVRVRNLAGHKLPTGVGFRRAFLELQLLDDGGRVLWASGRSDDLGALMGPDGQPLPCELSDDPRALQPHHQVITREDQVQIYEERHADSAGRLTISFLGLWRLVKDNRLLPRGFRKAAPEYLRPVGVGDDPDYRGGAGADEITYRIPAGRARAVVATLYYQALPPYYLRQLFSTGSGKETQRLYYILGRLSLPPASPIAGWKLRIASARAAIE